MYDLRRSTGIPLRRAGAVAAGKRQPWPSILCARARTHDSSEQARKIADLEAQLQGRKPKGESRRVQEGLRKQVEQLTRERKKVEEQLCEKRDALEMEQAF